MDGVRPDPTTGRLQAALRHPPSTPAADLDGAVRRALAGARRRRQRRSLAAGTGAALLAAAAVVAAVTVLPQGEGRLVVPPATSSPRPTAVPSPTASPSVRASTSRLTPPPAPTSSPGSGLAGFRPADVSFVSSRRGWAVGTVPCAGARCGALVTTRDGGLSWTRIGAPPPGISGLRFADESVGYAWQAGGPLHVTGDGGRTWTRTGPTEVLQVEPAAGTVWLLTGPEPPDHVWRAPVGATSFTEVGTTPNRTGGIDVHGPVAYVLGRQGAGPVATALQVRTADTVRDAPVPCVDDLTSVPDAHLGVSTDGSVLLVCDTVPLSGGPSRERAYVSSDQARTWTEVAAPPTAPSDVTAVRGRRFAWGRDLLVSTGGSWTVALRGPSSGRGFRLVGFQDDLHGVALDLDDVLSTTTDGGRTWRTVRFG